MKIKSLVILSLISMGLVGCTAIQNTSQHSTLQVSSTDSSTIMLNPFQTEQKLIYVQVQNNADPNINITDLLDEKLTAKGYTLVTDPSKADLLLQVNIVSLSRKVNANASNSNTTDEAGAAAAGGTLAATSMGGNPFTHAVFGALAGAVGTAVVDGILQDVTYTVQTQVQILSKIPANEVAAQGGSSTTTTSTSSANTSTAQKVTHYNLTQVWQTSQTQITTTADKVDLSITGAAPAISQSIAGNVASMF